MQRKDPADAQYQKAQMGKIILYSLMVIWLGEMGCKKNSAMASGPMGVYLELTPDSANTTLDFISAREVTIRGGSLSSQGQSVSQTLGFSINGERIFFIADSAGVSDSSAFYIFLSSDTLRLATCPPGVPCAAESRYYIFRKQ